MSEEFILYRYACVQNIYFVVHQVRTKMLFIYISLTNIFNFT